MPNREEALRKILEVASPGKLTEEQRRELLAHLDDSVEAKVAAGTDELDAVALAFQELGDLEKIARKFPERPAAVTPEGWVWGSWSLEAGYVLFLTFAGLLAFISPRLVRMFDSCKAPMPGLTLLCVDLGTALREFWWLAVPALVALGWGVIRFRRSAHRRWTGLAFSVLSVVLCAVAVVAVALPFMTLLDGIGARR